MGLNAFFAFTLCQAMGYSWRQALAIMLIEGRVFILITFLNVRERILDAIPTNLRYAVSAGIGLFIAFIGLKNAGIIVSNEATFVGLGRLHADGHPGMDSHRAERRTDDTQGQRILVLWHHRCHADRHSPWV